MKYSYRIMKYRNINKNGGVTSGADEWTSFYDIGAKIDKEEYEKVEREYINYAVQLCDCMAIKTLNIEELEINTTSSPYLNGQKIRIEQLDGIIKSILREEIWCKLTSVDCEFHFGYDFYMYFVSTINPNRCINKIQTSLTVQNYKSPYF